MNQERMDEEDLPSSDKPDHYEHLSEGHWFAVAERLYKESEEIPDPLQIRAQAIIDAFGLPSGEASALEANGEGGRVSPEKDRIIAELLTNKAGVLIDEKTGVVSTDFRDIYPDGLPEELAQALDPDTRAIMDVEYEHAQHSKETCGDTKHLFRADCSVNYFRLPGGVDLFLRGYVHHRTWQKNHGKFLQRANKHAGIIAIEGYSDRPFGDSLDLKLSNSREQEGHYDALMREAIDGGFQGLFTEVDARDMSKIDMESILPHLSIPSNLSESFFQNYFSFFQREHPRLAEIIGSPEGLKRVLTKQSMMSRSVARLEGDSWRHGKRHEQHAYLDRGEKVALEPTFRELGQFFFTDALAAIKLHLIAKLMADGHIPKGPIIDYEGSRHSASKSFFLRYPRYAAEVVLRAINELMAGKVKKRLFFKQKRGLQEIGRLLKDPNWPDAMREMVRLPFKKPEDDPTHSKTTALGSKQMKLLDYPIDVLKIYDIDPEQAMPNEEQIREIRAKLGAVS